MKAKQLDLRKYTPAGAAKKLYKFIREKSKESGQNPDIETGLFTPEQTEKLGYGKAWMVMWESGPFEWAVSLTLGGSMYQGEMNDYSYTKPPEVLLSGAEKYIAEPYHRFDIGFYKA